MVEAEIGRLGGVEEHVVVSEEDAILTKADEAERFMNSSGADYLAVAIGTSHGANKGTERPYSHHERIQEIAGLIPNPLVMHGASGVPQDVVERLNDAGGQLADAVGIHKDDVRKAVTEGIAKIDTDTELGGRATNEAAQLEYETWLDRDPNKSRVVVCNPENSATLVAYADLSVTEKAEADLSFRC